MKFFIILFLLVASIAKAENFSCHFTLSCLENELCADYEGVFSVFHEGDKAYLKTPGLTFEVAERFDHANDTYSYVTDLERNATHLLTIFTNGSARPSAHTFLDKAISITKIGRCTKVSN